MRKYILILALALLCASTLALSETKNSTFTAASMSNMTSADQVNESAVQFTMINLTAFGENHPVKTGFNVSQVACGNNASTNLVQAAPGAVMKLHYHENRDEIAYIIKGEAIFTLAGKNYTARAGDLMYIPSMTLHRVAIIGNETFQAVSTFTPPFDGKDRIYMEQ